MSRMCRVCGQQTRGKLGLCWEHYKESQERAAFVEVQRARFATYVLHRLAVYEHWRQNGRVNAVTARAFGLSRERVRQIVKRERAKI